MATLRERTEKLKERQGKNRTELGGKERIERQHQKNKLTARERLELLFDAGTFAEYGVLAAHMGALPDEETRPSPADGVICGVGDIDGRQACAAIYDFTVFG